MADVNLMQEDEVREVMERTMKRYLGDLGDKAEKLDEVLSRAEGVLTKQKVARLLNVTPYTVMNRYVKEKGLPVYRPGKAPLFLLEDVKEWIREHRD